MQYTIHCKLQCRLPLHSSDLVIFGQIHCNLQCNRNTGNKNVFNVPHALQLHCRGTLRLHFSLCSVVAVYMYTAQSMQSMYSVPCSYPACTLHFGLGLFLPHEYQAVSKYVLYPRSSLCSQVVFRRNELWIWSFFSDPPKWTVVCCLGQFILH